MSTLATILGELQTDTFIFNRGEDGAQLELAIISGSLGNQWKKWRVQMVNRTDPYQIVVEATVGLPGKSDIAIDDVVFDQNCVYYDGPYGTTTTNAPTEPSKTTKTTPKTTKTTTKTTQPTSKTTQTTSRHTHTPETTTTEVYTGTLIIKTLKRHLKLYFFKLL